MHARPHLHSCCAARSRIPPLLPKPAKLGPFCRALLPKEQLSQGMSPPSSSPVAGILGAYEASRAAQPPSQAGKEECIEAQVPVVLLPCACVLCPDCTML